MRECFTVPPGPDLATRPLPAQPVARCEPQMFFAFTCAHLPRFRYLGPRRALYLKPCDALAYGHLSSALIQFEDGERVVTSRRFLERIKK